MGHVQLDAWAVGTYSACDRHATRRLTLTLRLQKVSAGWERGQRARVVTWCLTLVSGLVSGGVQRRA
jgi:hypothetical protein